KGKGWHVYDRSVAARADWHFGARRGGAFAGIYGVYQSRSLSKSGETARAHVQQLIVAPAAGYDWFPSSRLGLFVSPNFIVAVKVAETGKAEIGASTFREGSILPLPGVNVGWEF